MSYKHLSLEERHYIELSMKNEKSLTAIATELGRSLQSCHTCQGVEIT